MDKIQTDIVEVKQRIAALKKLQENASVFDYYSIQKELLEANARLGALEKLLQKELEKEEQTGGARKRPTGAVEGPSQRKRYGDVDLTTLRNVAAHQWLQDFERLEENEGEIVDTVNGEPLSKYLKIIDPVRQESSSRNTVIFESCAMIQNLQDSEDPEGIIDAIFRKLLKIAFSSRDREPDKFNLQFYGDTMTSAYYIPFRDCKQNNLSAIKAEFFRLSTSDTLSSIFNKKLGLKISCWYQSRGSCSHMNEKNVVPCDRAANNFCLSRAIVYGKAYLTMDILQFNRFVALDLENETNELMQKSGLSLRKQAYNLEDAEKLLEILGSEFRLVIYDNYKNVILNTPLADFTIVLLLKNNHYDFIPKLNAFLKLPYFCVYCLKQYRPDRHPECTRVCKLCLNVGKKPCEEEKGKPSIYCDECRLWFANGRKKQSLCSKRKFCLSCKKIIEKRSGRHYCETLDNQECRRCGNGVIHDEKTPFCWISPKKAEVPSRLKYIFFDIETFTENNHHIPIVIASTNYCTVCIDLDIPVDEHLSKAPPNCCCGTYASRHRVFNSFDGKSAIAKFIDFLFKRSSKNGEDKVPVLVIAHNNSMFDLHLCLKEIYNRGVKVELVAQGFKIFSAKIIVNQKAPIIFKDSLNFLLQPLRKLPETFNFSEDASKSYFPFKYLKMANLHVELSTLPPMEYYAPDEMRVKEREKFLKWYTQHYQTPFCLKRDVIIYCKLDVLVLQKACVAFRSIMLKETGLDPFFVATTCAKFAFVVFQSSMLRPRMLVNVPEQGYRKFERQSEIAIKYFRLYEKIHNVQIQDSTWQCGEFKIPDTKKRIDGVIRDKDGNIDKVLEVFGCYFHACSKCFPNPKQLLVGGRPARDIWLETEARIRELKKLFNVEIVWECEIKKLLKSDKKLKVIYDEIKIAPRLQLREMALRGGRVEGFCIYYECGKDEEIRLVDFCSLYPFVKKYRSYPYKNPQILTAESIENLPWTKKEHNIYKGILLVEVLPPSNLELPLLGYTNKNGNFIFSCCRSCGDSLSPTCDHNQSERSWIGAYTHVEINKSLEIGYSILQVFEVWHYDHWTTPGDPDSDIFGVYVDKWLRSKIESSGWPTDDPEKREEYIKEYEAREGIVINKDAVEFNPGRRAVAKIMSNSLWGKLCQSNNKSEVRITKTPAEFFKVMTDDTLEVLDIAHLNEHTDRVVVKPKKEFLPDCPTTCLPVACYVTSYARMELFEALSLCQDPHSVFYVLRKGDKPLPEGDFLGDLQREHGDKKILEFCCAGPKNYCYLMEDSKGEKTAILKVRGFPLTYKAEQLLNYHKVKEHILRKFGYEPGETSSIGVPYQTIKRTKYSDLVNVNFIKQWQAIHRKGIPTSDMFIKPFGFKG